MSLDEFGQNDCSATIDDHIRTDDIIHRVIGPLDKYIRCQSFD